MASFDKFLIHLTQAEAGYQNARIDSKGNKNSLGVYVGTNHGISAPVYEQIIGHPPTAQEMKAITKDEANAIYKSLYWNVLNADAINSQEIANNIADHAVNAGQGSAIQLVQQRLFLDGHPVSFNNSGKLNMDAVNIINKLPENEQKLFFNSYSIDRKAAYESMNKPRELKDAWLARVDNYFGVQKDVTGWSEKESIDKIQLQNVLFNGDPKHVDGIIGNQTVAALKEYQQNQGLNPTGILDTPTRESLNSAITKEFGNSKPIDKVSEISVGAVSDKTSENNKILTDKQLAFDNKSVDSNSSKQLSYDNSKPSLLNTIQTSYSNNKNGLFDSKSYDVKHTEIKSISTNDSQKLSDSSNVKDTSSISKSESTSDKTPTSSNSTSTVTSSHASDSGGI